MVRPAFSCRRLAGGLAAGLAVCAVLAGTPAPAAALSLDGALVRAYSDNPRLRAQYRAVRKAQEGLPKAAAGLRPSLSAQADTGSSHTRTTTDGSTTTSTTTPRSLTLQLQQSLFDGGKTAAQRRQAALRAAAARAQFHATEQQVLLDVVRAYANVLRDRQVVQLRQNNVEVLKRQLDSTRQRFEVGEVTKTAVRRTEARLAGARAELQRAQGELASSEATFRQRVGLPAPQDLDEIQRDLALPESRQRAVQKALETNPAIAAADRRARAAEAGIDLARSGLLPQANLTVRAGRSWDQRSAGPEHTDSLSITAQVQVPLYSGGRTRASVRESKEAAAEQRFNVDKQRRAVRQRTVDAWQRWQAARAAIESRQAQVDAAQVALEGVREAYEVGTRTLLDVLEAEQEALTAQIDLARSRRNAQVAAYSLLAAVGAMNANQLGLDVAAYDLGQRRAGKAGRWLGLDVADPAAKGAESAQNEPR